MNNSIINNFHITFIVYLMINQKGKKIIVFLVNLSDYSSIIFLGWECKTSFGYFKVHGFVDLDIFIVFLFPCSGQHFPF